MSLASKAKLPVVMLLKLAAPLMAGEPDKSCPRLLVLIFVAVRSLDFESQ